MIAKVYVRTNSPEGLHLLMAELMSTGDINDLMSICDGDVTFSADPLTPTVAPWIEEDLAGFLALRPAMDFQTERVIPGGRRRAPGIGVDHERYRQRGSPHKIVRYGLHGGPPPARRHMAHSDPRPSGR